MPRRLIALFDGTWDKAKTRTNVERLWRLIAPVGAAGDPQLCQYVAGVGVAPGIGHWLGGAFGWGLAGNIKTGYRWLSENWRPGDEIWLFGFSRGAFTARGVAGLIRKCGLALPDDAGHVGDVMVDDAYAYYRNKVVPGVLVNGFDPTATWRRAHAAREVAIRCIGVWDTVGALGIPGVAAWFPFSRKRYGFHDTDLSSIVEYAYQALALDEHRVDFKPTKWTRVPGSLAPGEPPSAWKPGQREVEQRWFVGAHADVGGGEAADGAGRSPDTLPEIALAWLQAKAALAGLAFTGPFAPAVDAELATPNPSYKDFLHGAYRFFKPPWQRVIGGGVNETIDASVWAKWRAQAAYRPAPIVTATATGLVETGSEMVHAQSV